MYSSTSDPLHYGTGGITPSPTNWSEVSAGNPPGDRRGIGSSGPFTLNAGAIIEIDLALVFGRDMTGSGPQAGIATMQESIDTVRNQYNRGLSSNCGSGMITSIKNKQHKDYSSLIYPNPFNNELTINYELENNTATLAIYNLVGEQIKTQTITQKTTVIDLDNEPNGIYLVTITDGTTRISKKVLKQ